VLAVAHIRGGGEFGEEWHHAGRLTDKQNAFDDFAACGRHLVETSVTTDRRLTLMGGSNGAFNVTEFGTVRDPKQFQALYAYSPYHHVEDGTSYPAVLLTAGEFDPRVDAYHAKKMTARLQAATSSDQPVLLRIEAGGHGVGESLDQRVAELADVYAFLFDRLGVDYRTAAGAGGTSI
jgi:prolyl oligopeptidase